MKIALDWTDVIRRVGLANMAPRSIVELLDPDLVVRVDGVPHVIRAASFGAGDRIVEELELVPLAPRVSDRRAP